MSVGAHFVPTGRFGRDLRTAACDASGRLKVMPASFYRNTTPEERAMLGHATGAYVLPTLELVAWLRDRIAGRRAVEIGAGNGVLAEALGITATDSKLQQRPEIAEHYRRMGQPTTTYGPNVEHLDSDEAVNTLQPEVVVAAWVTHRYDEKRHEAGGNYWGVDESYVLSGCQEYLFVGNTQVHAGKSIWDRPHELLQPDWLFSRAINGTPDFLAIWTGEGQGWR